MAVLGQPERGLAAYESDAEHYDLVADLDLAVEDVGGVHGVLGAGQVAGLGLAARGADDGVVAVQVVGCRLAADDVDALLVHGGDEVVLQAADVGLELGDGGLVELPAELALLKDGDGVPAQGEDARGLEAGGAAAHDGDVLFHRGGGDLQLALAADLRVERAADGLVAVEGALEAALVAADAGTDVLGVVGLGLLRPLGIRPERAPQPDEVALAGGDDLLGELRRVDGAGGDDRDGDDLLDGLGRPDVVPMVHSHRGGLVYHGVVVAAGDVEGVDALVLERLGEHERVLYREAVGLVVRAAQADGDGEVGADLLAHVARYLDVDAHAVLKRAAVEVGAVVRSGGEEVRQQIAVCAVDLDEVEAGDLRAPGRVAEGVDYVLDLLDGQHVGHGLQAVLIP